MVGITLVKLDRNRSMILYPVTVDYRPNAYKNFDNM